MIVLPFPLPHLYSRYVYANTYVCTSTYRRSFSSLLRRESGWSHSCGCPTTIAGPLNAHHHRRWFGCRGFFSFLSSFCYLRSGSGYSRTLSTVFARLGRRRIVSRSREWPSFVSRYLILQFSYCCRCKYINIFERQMENRDIKNVILTANS